ncbi:ribonuclease H-like domain-containing protein [Tanacetum coccineum]
MRPFRYPGTILNTINHLGKFDGKADEGFFIGYSTNSKAFKVFNSRTRIVEENMHVQFSENTPNIVRNGPNWIFDRDTLTKSMNYKSVVAGNQSNGNAGTKACDDAGKARVKTVLLPLWTQDPSFSSSTKDSSDARFKPSGEEEKKDGEDPRNEDGNPSKEGERVDQEKDTNASGNSTNSINTVSPTINTAGIKDTFVNENTVYECDDYLNMPDLEEIGRFSDAEYDDLGADINNLDTYFQVSPALTTRIHKDHRLNQVIGDLKSATETRQMTKNLEEYGRTQESTSSIKGSKLDRSYARGASAVQKDERGIVIKNKARLVAQGYTQEEGIDYDEIIDVSNLLQGLTLCLQYVLVQGFSFDLVGGHDIDSDYDEHRLELIKDDLKWNAKAAKDEIIVNTGKSQEGLTYTKPKDITTAATTTITTVTRPKARGVVVQEPSEFLTTTSQPSKLPQAKDKDKAKMVEAEKPLKMKEQIRLDEELALKLQAEEEEQARSTREKAKKVEEANIS